MQCISKLAIAIAVCALLMFAPSGVPQTMVNPSTQINWNAVVGNGAPSSGCPNPNNVTLTNGSTRATVASGSGILPNETVTGTGIPSGTLVKSIFGTTIVLTQAATVSGSQTLNFYPLGQPYTDSTGGTGAFTCTMAGWKGGGSGGSCNVALSVNGSLLTGCVALITVNTP